MDWSEALTVPAASVVDLRLVSEGASERGEVEAFWSVTASPAGESGTFEPGPEELTPSYTVALAGTYTFTAVATDSHGLSSCSPASVVATVVPLPPVRIRAELVAPTTLPLFDLHFVHPDGEWDHMFYDCNINNRSPFWGALLESGDGWTSIDYREPDAGLYLFGVRSLPMGGEAGVGSAQISVFIDGQERLDMSIEDLPEGAFWYVGTLDWPSQEVVVVDQLFPDGFP
jgi:hypothetical protein